MSIDRRQPRQRQTHTLRHDAWVPAWTLRLAIVLIGTAASFAMTDVVHWRVAVIALGVLGSLLPVTYAFWAIPLVLALGVLTGAPDPWRTSIAVLASHLVITLAPLTVMLSPGVRVLLSALRPTAIRFLWLQVAAQGAAWVTFAITTMGAGRGGASFAIVGGASFVILAVLLLHRLRTARADAEHPPDVDRTTP